jgi:hypothetical protein
VEPYCQYAMAGRIVEDKSPPSRTITIPAGATTLDLFDSGVPGHLGQPEQLKLFIVEPKDSPNCITPQSPCSPLQSSFGAQIVDWTQVAEHDHGKPGSSAMVAYPGRPPTGQEFSISYGRDSAVLSLGAVPTADLELTIFPQLDRTIPYGSGSDKRGEKVLNLPSGVGDIQTFLNSLGDFPSDEVYPVHASASGEPESDTISQWVQDNRAACGGWGFLRGGLSNQNLMIDLSDDALYDPQLTVNAQYLLAGTFGLMQYGIINHQYDIPRGKMMRLEYDFGKPYSADHEYHVFQQVLNPAVSVQVGAAQDSYLLHKTEHFENDCQADCSQTVLLNSVHNMLRDYNGVSTYADEVLNQMHLFSMDSTIWGVPKDPTP